MALRAKMHSWKILEFYLMQFEKSKAGTGEDFFSHSFFIVTCEMVSDFIRKKPSEQDYSSGDQSKNKISKGTGS
jgi:hypothetical protein